MKKILIIGLLSLIVLTGCSSKKEVSLICTQVDGGDRFEEVMKGHGDVVESSTQTTVIDYKDAMEESDISEDELKDALLVTATDYLEIKGINYTVTTDKTFATETLEVDYSTADFEKLVEVGLLGSAFLDKDMYISFEETKLNYESNGAACSFE